MPAPSPEPKRRKVDGTVSANTLSRPFKSPLRRPPTTPVKGDREEGTDTSTGILTPPDTSHRTTANRMDSGKKGSVGSTAVSLLSSLTRRPIPSTSTLLGSPPKRPLHPSRNSPFVLALQKQHSAAQSRLACLKGELDMLEQALRIERRRGGVGGDNELEALTGRWRAVAREAAEEAFGGARERVERMGGVAAWKEKGKKGGKGDVSWGWDIDVVEDAAWRRGLDDDSYAFRDNDIDRERERVADELADSLEPGRGEEEQEEEQQGDNDQVRALRAALLITGVHWP